VAKKFAGLGKTFLRQRRVEGFEKPRRAVKRPAIAEPAFSLVWFCVTPTVIAMTSAETYGRLQECTTALAQRNSA
jgi:hypothetical protein